jgi:hypothetical protein
LTSGFKIRFSLVGFSGSGQNCNLDNITINVGAMPPDASVKFQIDGTQVWFDTVVDASGTHIVPKSGGTTEIIADSSQAVLNNSGSTGDYSYACFKDVTALVKTFGQTATGGGTNHPGNGTYLVGNVTGDTGNQWSYAAWSLLIIYESPDTKGHQLYLYDKFRYVDNNNANNEPDFDGDGAHGGNIAGFIVPNQILGPPIETIAGRLTAFVGEGDNVWTGDYMKLNGASLSNSQSPASNVWNSKSGGSFGVTGDGIDIDTFDITWASTLLLPGDTSAFVDMPTQSDSWNLVYLILSFRSEATSGGIISYMVKR